MESKAVLTIIIIIHIKIKLNYKTENQSNQIK